MTRFVPDFADEYDWGAVSFQMGITMLGQLGHKVSESLLLIYRYSGTLVVGAIEKRERNY